MLKKVSVSIGEYNGEYDINVNVWHGFDDFTDFTPTTWNNEAKALKTAKGIFKTICNYTDKATFEGIENC